GHDDAAKRIGRRGDHRDHGDILERAVQQPDNGREERHWLQQCVGQALERDIGNGMQPRELLGGWCFQVFLNRSGIHRCSWTMVTKSAKVRRSKALASIGARRYFAGATWRRARSITMAVASSSSSSYDAI